MRRNATRAEGTERGDDSGRRGMPLSRTRWAIVGIVIGVLGSSWVGVGRGRPGAGDAVAETTDEGEGSIDGAVRKVAQGVQDASTNVRDRVSRARASVRNQNLETAVKARLLQDKSLEAQNIDVQVEGDGTVILMGQVPDDGDKDAAVDLTRDVRGVARVEDHLAVPPVGRVFANRTDDETAPVRTRRAR
jgi:hypothetical protein